MQQPSKGKPASNPVAQPSFEARVRRQRWQLLPTIPHQPFTLGQAMNAHTTAAVENAFWAPVDRETDPADLHAMPAARIWVVELCPPVGKPFTTRISVKAGYLGQGERAAVMRHCSSFYPDHMIGDFWPTN